MITLLDHDGKEVTEELVVTWIKDVVCEYFHISRATLGEQTRAHVSSYPRKLFWYFGRCQYDISNKLLQNIASNIYPSDVITIQSQTALLQSHYNRELKYDITEIRKMLLKREELA